MRKCKVGSRDAFFDSWTAEGDAIVEYEDGKCGLVSLSHITFDPPYSEHLKEVEKFVDKLYPIIEVVDD